MEDESFIVDYGDPADIRAKLPVAHKILKRKEEDFEGWRDFVRLLERRAVLSPQERHDDPARGADDAGSKTHVSDGPQTLELVLEVLNRDVRKIRSRDIAEILRAAGHDLSNSTVSNALYYAAERATPRRAKTAAGRGFYAPLAYDEAPESANGAHHGDSGDQSNLNREAVQRLSGDGIGGNPGWRST